MMKKMLISLIAAVVLTVGVVAVGAQDDKGPRGAGSELAQEYTGLTSEALRTALRGGATLGELIEANGQSVDAFVAASVAEAQTRLDEAVASGRITHEQADERAAELEANITARLNGTFEGRNGGRRGN